MRVIRHKNELQNLLQIQMDKNHTIGFVPTMGALHEGHVSLVRRACAENDVAVVSIFVNPTQFDNEDDLENYPENLENDIAMLDKVSKDIVLFTPSESEIYDGNITSNSYDFNGLEKVMEGIFRVGHFNGVATIVEHLLSTVNPHRAYFGEKDFQQLQIVKKLVALKKIPCDIIGCPIEREPNGLAMSSRNERLTKRIRLKAGFIYGTLKKAQSKFGTENANVITEWVKTQYMRNPDFRLQYFQIADVDTLTPLIKKQEQKKYRAFIAVYAEDVRLIDNIALN
ncbi:MAG: pantoate--beta-alanine ligase [Bacteroidota bacterium]